MRSTRYVMALCAILILTFGTACKNRNIIDVVLTGPTPVTQCNDGRDNDRDGKIDRADPDCHTDGNPDNPDSYDLNDDDERDGPSGPSAPPSPESFSITTPISCTLVRGEYNVFLGWHGFPGVDSYWVEIRSSRDGIWRNVQEAGALVTIGNNAMVMTRLRTDFSHSFRVYALRGGTSTLWSTSEEAATCVKVPACRNLGDDDGDGLIDFGQDPGCTSREDEDESNPPPPVAAPSPSAPAPAPAPPVSTPGPGSPAPPPPPSNPCSGMSFSPSSGSGSRGTSVPYSLFAPTGCQVVFESNNHHAVSPTGGRIYFLNPGSATLCLRSTAGHGQVCGAFTTTQ